MPAANYDVAGLANAATENAPQREGLFIHILRSLQQSWIHEARRAIVRYAHLLPEGLKAADVLPFIAADQAQFGVTQQFAVLATTEDCISHKCYLNPKARGWFR